MRIDVVEYNNGWAIEFEKLKEELGIILSNLNPIVEHIGSTSVFGLAAKPVIDIAIGLESLDDLDKSIEPMIANNFIYYEVFNQSMPFRRLFVGLKERAHEFDSIFSEKTKIPHEEINQRRHCHIHAWHYGSEEWNRHIAFRDYLRAHPLVCQEYASIKKELSKKDWKDGMEYNEGKNSFIKHHERLALDFRKNQLR